MNRNGAEMILLPGFFRMASLAACLLLVSACDPLVTVRGNVPLEERIAMLEPGVSTRAAVQGLIGAPSTLSAFDPNVWYYMNQRREQWAFLDAKITDDQVLVLRFDDVIILRSVNRSDESSLRDVPVEQAESPTPEGTKPSVIRQLLGNFGRVSR